MHVKRISSLVLGLVEQRQLEEDVDLHTLRTLQVDPTVAPPDDGDAVRQHRELNMAAVDAAFPGFVLSASGVMIRDRKLLRASEMIYYYLMDPIWYRVHGGCVSGISSAELLAKLRRFNSCSTSAVYEQVLPKYLHKYRNLFFDKVTNEAELKTRFMALITLIIAAADGGDEKSRQELASAAGGLIAKRRQEAVQEIDDRAGYAGRVDLVFMFGHSQYEGHPFLAVEVKYIRSSLEGRRWFAVARDLLAQILQSQVGHRAPVGLAITQEGFKVFLFEVVCDEEITDHERQMLITEGGQVFRVFCFPEHDGELYRPDFRGVDDGFRIFGELARIISYIPDPVTPVQATRSIPVSPLTHDYYPRDAGFQISQTAPRGAARRGDIYMHMRDGSGGHTRLTSIDLNSYYSPNEIDELLDPLPLTASAPRLED